MAAQTIALTPHQPWAADRCRCRHPPPLPHARSLQVMGVQLPVHWSLPMGDWLVETARKGTKHLGQRSRDPAGVFWPGQGFTSPGGLRKTLPEPCMKPRGTKRDSSPSLPALPIPVICRSG